MPDGNPLGFGLRFGGIELESKLGTTPTAEDGPIVPGDT